ncbi:MAG: glycosyltransferase family 2 protein [Pseudomonadota bacterium]|nr:glycosyltransferase family 2 protein [Pseudomonadota bacterium]
MIAEQCVLSAVISIRNEEDQLADCLAMLSFADEVVVLLDDCTDGSREIAARYTDRLVDGDWALEGDRRNAGIEACRGVWIFEIDADERVPVALGAEIRQVVETSLHDWHGILVDNYIGDHLVRHGWGGSWGKAQYPGLFRKGTKRWGRQRLHPALELNGSEGPPLNNRVDHYVDRNISDMMRRLDSYTTARARDIREHNDGGSYARNLRRFFTRFWKCYVSRRGYREGKYGFLIALCAALYPLLSYLKATLEEN